METKNIQKKPSLRSFLSPSQRGEKGNTLIMVIMLMPIMLMCLALGIETSLSNYTKNTLNSALDQATQSAVGQAVNGNATQQNINLGPNLLATTNRLYDLNRTDKLRNLLCDVSITPGSDGSVVSPASGCKWRMTSWRVYTKNGNQYFEVKLHDYSVPPFGTILNRGYQSYTITSTARVTGPRE